MSDDASRDAAERLLTPAELEIMRVLWDRGPASVHEVMADLGGDRGYTTFSTLIRILEQKGFVESHKEGRRHVYAPVTPKPAYEATSLRALLHRVFDGSPAALVRRLLDAEAVDPAELESIERLIEAARSGDPEKP